MLVFCLRKSTKIIILYKYIIILIGIINSISLYISVRRYRFICVCIYIYRNFTKLLSSKINLYGKIMYRKCYIIFRSIYMEIRAQKMLYNLPMNIVLINHFIIYNYKSLLISAIKFYIIQLYNVSCCYLIKQIDIDRMNSAVLLLFISLYKFIKICEVCIVFLIIS